MENAILSYTFRLQCQDTEKYLHQWKIKWKQKEEEEVNALISEDETEQWKSIGNRYLITISTIIIK